MKKGFYLLLVLVFFLASCSEDGNRSSSVHIQLLPPEGYSTLPYEEMEVTLTKISRWYACDAERRESLDIS